MAARIWVCLSPEITQEIAGGTVKEWREEGTVHTLVAHHQVCQTLKENKSTVSREQGIVGSCVRPTRRHLVQSWDVCVTGGSSGTGGDRRAHTGFHTMSIHSTGAGCDASSLTYASSFRIFNIRRHPVIDKLPTHPPPPRQGSLNTSTVKGRFFGVLFFFFTSTFSVPCCSKSSDFQRDCATPQLNNISLK